nr:zinc finger, CCHC-type [Tanacetum cinerariifolium]
MEQPMSPAPDLEIDDPKTIDKYYESVNVEQESRLYRNCLKRLKHSMLANKRMVSWDYDQFIQNYNMYSMGKTIAELHVMLKLLEKGIPKKTKTPVVLTIREGRDQDLQRK